MEIDKILNVSFKTNKQKAVVNLRYTANYISNIQNSFMMQFDLSMAQFNILRILRGAGDIININTVKDRMVEKSPNITRLMDKLIDKEYIERYRCENDRRVVFVKISKKGCELLSELDMVQTEKIDLSGNLTEDEALQLSFLLDKLRGE